MSFEKAIDGQSTGRALLFREMAIVIGSLLACLVLISMALLGLELRYSFIVAAFFSLWPLLIVKKRRPAK